MDIETTPLKDCYLIYNQLHGDHRGFFMEAFNQPKFQHLGLTFQLQQINVAKSKKKVFRGLHFQLAPFAQTKIVFALTGSVIDLVVDLRKNSSTYLQHFSVQLDTPDKALWIPKGFAHGYMTLEDDTIFQYAVDEPYHASSERSLRVDDPMLQISTRFPDALISPKDLNAPSFQEIEHEL